MDESVDEPILRVVGLQTYFYVSRGIVKAVDGVSFLLKKGEVLGLVGESGCGKSVTGMSILRLVPDPPGRIVGGNIYFRGEDLLTKSEEEMRKLRGSEITMIQQNPNSSLNPVFRIGNQVAEAITIHQRLKKRSLWDKVLEILRLVKIPSPEVRVFDYPHQMSGGMRQRVAGAIALSCQASLLIADEPTTNLDVTTQMEYLRLLEEIKSSTGISMIFVTHDLGIVTKICNRVVVMYAGKIVESGNTLDIMQKPMHPYTSALINSVPQPGSKGKKLSSIKGQPPDPVNLPRCCSFAKRCPRSEPMCFKEPPIEVQFNNNHHVRCFYAEYRGN
jgi:oligopeptide/dipeptide ABC transporter ATP-binding protein